MSIEVGLDYDRAINPVGHNVMPRPDPEKVDELDREYLDFLQAQEDEEKERG